MGDQSANIQVRMEIVPILFIGYLFMMVSVICPIPPVVALIPPVSHGHQALIASTVYLDLADHSAGILYTCPSSCDCLRCCSNCHSRTCNFYLSVYSCKDAYILLVLVTLENNCAYNYYLQGTFSILVSLSKFLSE